MGRQNKKHCIRLEVQYESTAGMRANHSIALLAAMFAGSKSSRSGAVATFANSRAHPSSILNPQTIP